MIDMEKVIKGLEKLRNDLGYGLPDRSNVVMEYLNSLTDAIALLKEQEVVKPRRIDGKRNHFIKCGNCNCDMVTGYQFCPNCGKPVKWK